MFPEATRFARSSTLRLAFFAVGVHTPALHVTLLVGAEEIESSPCAVLKMPRTSPTADAVTRQIRTLAMVADMFAPSKENLWIKDIIFGGTFQIKRPGRCS